jgi:hypothetical protein
MSKYKFVLTLPCDVEVDSEYDVDGHVAWPNYSQAEPVRYKGVFDTYGEAERYASEFHVYKYVLKYYYATPYDSFEDEDECPRWFVSLYDAEDAACRELDISPGDMVTPPKYEVKREENADEEIGIPEGVYKYRLMHEGECVLDSIEDLGEYFDTERDAEYAAVIAARENLVEIDEVPYELVPIEILKVEIVEIDD